jgi:sterol desaturase/sphingolipid hydroxylase (fatty acid hydroxylase superfamily)
VLIIAVIALLAILALGIETAISDHPHDSISTNVVMGAWQLIFVQLLEPAMAPVMIFIVSRWSHPLIHLRGGRFLLPSLLVFLAVRDLADYLFHRAQHKISWLWAMHSFHHSDTTLNATSGYRHYWLERPLLAFAYAPIGLVLYLDPSVHLVGAFFMWILPLYGHMNIPLNFGWMFPSPQLHRVHHSTNPEHYNTNFAGLFPLWDVAFGTYLAADESHLETGIGEPEPGIITSFLWPARRLVNLRWPRMAGNGLRKDSH